MFDIVIWLLVIFVIACFIVILRFNTANVPARAWPRIIALIASCFIILSPFLSLTEHPLFGGLMLYEISLPCAICLVLAGLTGFTAWFLRYRFFQIALLPIHATLFVWLFNIYQQDMEKVQRMMSNDNLLVSSFAKIVTKHMTMGRGWITLSIVLIILTVVTIIEFVLIWIDRRPSRDIR